MLHRFNPFKFCCSLEIIVFISVFILGSVLQDLQNVNVPELHPGILGEELKKQTSTQRALYRRLFMDIEREQVKELRKKNEHRKKIAL